MHHFCEPDCARIRFHEGACSPKPDYDIDARHAVTQLVRLPPEWRRFALTSLPFCTSCGEDYPNGSSVCHCENDE